MKDKYIVYIGESAILLAAAFLRPKKKSEILGPGESKTTPEPGMGLGVRPELVTVQYRLTAVGGDLRDRAVKGWYDQWKDFQGPKIMTDIPRIYLYPYAFQSLSHGVDFRIVIKNSGTQQGDIRIVLTANNLWQWTEGDFYQRRYMEQVYKDGMGEVIIPNVRPGEYVTLDFKGGFSTVGAKCYGANPRNCASGFRGASGELTMTAYTRDGNDWTKVIDGKKIAEYYFGAGTGSWGYAERLTGSNGSIVNRSMIY